MGLSQAEESVKSYGLAVSFACLITGISAETSLKLMKSIQTILTASAACPKTLPKYLELKSVTKRLLCLASLAGLLVSGCASVSPSHPEAGEVVGEIAQIGKPATHPRDDSMYYILAAELAGQRGDYQAAMDNYVKAAALTQDVKVLQRATQIALFLKKPEQALDVSSRWVQADPNNPEALRLYAMLLIKAGRTEEGFEQLSLLLSKPGVDVETTVLDLVKLLSTDATARSDSVEMMRRLTERYPRLAELHFAYGLLAADKGQNEVALAETEKALAHHPEWSRARLLQAQILTKMGNPQKAKEIIQKALKADPKNQRLRLIYSQFLAKSGDSKAAQKEISKVLESDPNNEDALAGQALSELDQGDENKAKGLFERLTESPSKRFQAYFYLGLIEARQRNFQAALDWFDKVTEGPAAFDAQLNAVTTLYNLERLPEARNRLAELRKKYPQEALRLYLLEAELLNKIKDYQSSYEILNQALQALPGQADLLYARAILAGEMGKDEVLISDLSALLAQNPDDANALNALGFTWAERGERLEDAKRNIAKALALKPGDPAIMDSYGWVYYRLQDYKTALEYLKKAYDANQDPEIGSHYGEVLWESGNKELAKKVWQEVRNKEPNHKNLIKVMEKYPEAFQ